MSKPNLVFVASSRARSGASSRLLRLVRDHATILQRYSIHGTRGTARRILGSGLFAPQNIVIHKGGQEGGIAELAAMVAQGDCAAVFLLLDPSDPWSDAVENRALKRVCIERRIRLLTTYAASVRWLELEADPTADFEAISVRRVEDEIEGWKIGHPNVRGGKVLDLPVGKRTVALISHDKKKREMVRFVSEHTDLLAEHHRILTTGTTGWLLKLLFVPKSKLDQMLKSSPLREDRLESVFESLLKDLRRVPSGHVRAMCLDARGELDLKPNRRFVEKITPLPSGPRGGDVLIANEILNCRCHSIIFFHDPQTAHPHSDDIRLLEHTSQLPGVFAECVSDELSAENWTRGLELELSDVTRPANVAHRMRSMFPLKEVVLAPTTSNEDGDTLGRELARAAAAFFHQELSQLRKSQSEVRIGVAWGRVASWIVEELTLLTEQGLLEPLTGGGAKLLWSPIIGIITAEVSAQEASIVVEGLREFYGGEIKPLQCAGFTREASGVPTRVRDVVDELEKADLVLTSAAPWHADASLLTKTGLSPGYFPDLEGEAIGIISGVFVDKNGSEVEAAYKIVGLDYMGFKRVATQGNVILVCGGDQRVPVVGALLRARLVSSLVTTVASAKALVEAEKGRES